MTSPNITGTRDTEGVVGNDADAPSGSANIVTPKDTEGVVGGDPYNPTAPPAPRTDTSGAFGGATTTPTDTSMTGTVDTTQGSYITQAHPTYRAPSAPPAVTLLDTTHTDQPISDGTNPSETTKYLTGTPETARFGAVADTSGGAVPAAPTSPTVVAGPRQVIVGWTPPSQVSGAARTGYIIKGSTCGTTYAAANATSVVVTNLVPNQAYTFQVAATNKNGVGAFSVASASATPYNPDEADVNKPGGIDAGNRVNAVYRPDGTVKPGTGGTSNAPTSVVATPGNTQLSIAWTAPTIGGTMLSSLVEILNGAGTVVASGTVSGAGTTKVITGLTNGTAYTARVTSTNAHGVGETSAPSAVATPRTVPGAPTIGVAVGGAGQATVNWTAPVSNGGSAITGYTITKSTGGTVSALATDTSKVVTGLTPSTPITFTVHATNAAGNSAESASSNSVTPS